MQADSRPLTPVWKLQALRHKATGAEAEVLEFLWDARGQVWVRVLVAGEVRVYEALSLYTYFSPRVVG